MSPLAIAAILARLAAPNLGMTCVAPEDPWPCGQRAFCQFSGDRVFSGVFWFEVPDPAAADGCSDRMVRWRGNRGRYGFGAAMRTWRRARGVRRDGTLLPGR